MTLPVLDGVSFEPPQSLFLRLMRSAGGVCRLAILRAHAWAEASDLVPDDYGGGAEIARHDAEVIAREWRRQLRRWAVFNPEEALAWKVGAAALGTVLLALVWVIASWR